MNIRLPFLLFVLILLPVQAGAADGWFGGIKVSPWVNRADALLNLDRSDGGTSTAPAAAASSATGRRRPTLPVPARRLDVEVGYGEGAAGPGDGLNGSPRTNQPGRNFRLAGVGTLPIGDGVGLTGRVGAYKGDIEMQNAYRLTPDESVHPTYGMGVRYDFSPNLRVQGGWDRYHLGASLRPGDGGIDLLTIGLKYRF